MTQLFVTAAALITTSITKTTTTTTLTTTTTTTSQWIASLSASVTSLGFLVTKPSAQISTVSLQAKISVARANISAEVNTINDYHNDRGTRKL